MAGQFVSWQNDRIFLALLTHACAVHRLSSWQPAESPPEKTANKLQQLFVPGRTSPLWLKRGWALQGNAFERKLMTKNSGDCLKRIASEKKSKPQSPETVVNKTWMQQFTKTKIKSYPQKSYLSRLPAWDSIVSRCKTSIKRRCFYNFL